jgi:uncharacterized membrane protein YhaH (DUF805 family)
MSNPYGWSPPINGQPAVYFAPPAQSAPDAYGAAADAYHAAPAAYSTGYAPHGSSYAPYGTGSAPYATSSAAPHGTSYAPYDNGYGSSTSFMDQYNYQPPAQNPLTSSHGGYNPFQSVAARGARQKVTMTEAVILWLRNWKNFSGRASRSEYWWIRGVQIVGQILWWLVFLGVTQMGALSSSDDVMNLAVSAVLLGSVLVMFVLWIPTMSLTVRRLHDTDHSGWYFFIQYLPFGSWLLWRALRQGSDPAGSRFDDHMNRPYSVADIP